MYRKKIWMLRALALTLALWLALPVRAFAMTIEEVEARQEELQKENEELEAKIEALRSDEAQVLEYQAVLEEKISLTEQKIDAARESIQVMDREVSALEQKLELSRKEYQHTLDVFAERIKTLYKAGSVTTLEILLSSSSFSDFAMRSELMSSVTRHDEQLVDKIQEYLEKTQEDREKVQKMRQEEAQIKKELEADRKELEELYEENNQIVADLEAQQGQVQAAIEANEEEDAALDAELTELIRQKNEEEERRRQELADQGLPDNPSVPGLHDGFNPCWPLPGVGIGNITGHFGDMYSNGPHNGLDIGASYGTPIVASQAGEVIYADYHYSWGNNVLIRHNSTFSTRYAHMSSIAVSVGQYVEQNQVIGYVGSTGYSFGNHLHFEVYVDGYRVNPDPYLGI